jgi:hypothetical protein
MIGSCFSNIKQRIKMYRCLFIMMVNTSLCANRYIDRKGFLDDHVKKRSPDSNNLDRSSMVITIP